MGGVLRKPQFAVELHRGRVRAHPYPGVCALHGAHQACPIPLSGLTHHQPVYLGHPSYSPTQLEHTPNIG